MADITASMVKELREKSGAGMMDCKAALVETGGNMDEAMVILRKKGLAAASKKAGRVASEGVIQALVRGNVGIMFELNSETDFVANNADFRAMAQKIAEAAINSRAHDLESLLKEKMPGDKDGHDIAAYVTEKIATIKENITLRRYVRYEAGSSGVVGSYIHANGKIGVLVELDGASAPARGGAETTAKDIAMHVAAAEPRFLRREDVTESDLATEKEIARDQALKSGKPENVVDKIVTGKMEKFYGETVLLEQPYIREDKTTIKQLLAQRGKESNAQLTIKRFSRFKVGEGIEKPSKPDFASEVMAQAR